MTTQKPQSHYININGLQLHCLAWNFNQAHLPTILLFHGWLDHALAWSETLSIIAQSGYRILVPEQRGHGLSAHLPLHTHYHFPDYVADMQNFIHTGRLQTSPELILIGHSMGGSIATLLCGVGAVSAQRLILIEGLGPSHEPPETAFTRYKTHLEQRLNPRKPNIIPSIEAAAARIQRLTPKLSFKRALEFAHYITQPFENGYCWRWDARHRDKAPIGYDATRYQQVFQNIDIPTQLIWGADSWYMKLPDLQDRISSLPNILSQHTLNTGHSPHYEQPKELAHTLLNCMRM